jgi:hypothetical protein
MNLKSAWIITIGFGAAGPLSAEAYKCINSVDQFDICAAAKRIQVELAPSLPQMLDETMMLRSASAINNVVGLNATLLYSRALLESGLQQAGRTMESLESQMTSYTQTSVCSMPATAAFVKLGGKVLFTYQLEDGETLFQIPVDEC